MKKTVFFGLMLLSPLLANTQKQLTVSSVKWDESYTFDKSNVFKMEFYDKNKILMQTGDYITNYQSAGQNFVVRYIPQKAGNGIETVIDKKNEVAIQIIGTGGASSPYYSAGGFKYPTENELKKLEISPTEETKKIAGYICKKYTYTHKKIFGEVWITDKITLPNDVGVFRACKMAAIHNTLSVEGFVMEMTTEDKTGSKTLMTTVSVKNNEKYTVSLKGVDMGTAINKVNYYKF